MKNKSKKKLRKFLKKIFKTSWKKEYFIEDKSNFEIENVNIQFKIIVVREKNRGVEKVSPFS